MGEEEEGMDKERRRSQESLVGTPRDVYGEVEAL